MDGTFVKELERVIDNGYHTGQFIDIKGRTFLFEGNKAREIEEKELAPHGVEFSDLASFCKIINEEMHKLGTEKLFVKVNGPEWVETLSTLNEKMTRIYPYAANSRTPRFEFGTWLNYEDFVIGLRAKFVQTEDRDSIIKTIASIVNCDSQEMQDDGITQTVKTQKGTQLGQKETKSIVTLKPFRTFTEVNQPESEFLFRIRNNGTQFALFEADGGKWVEEAKYAIKLYIEKQIKDERVVVLV